MSAPTEFEIYVSFILLIVPVLTYALVKYLWNQPLRNGGGYFLGVEVPAGFYEGPGAAWLTGYHAMLGALYLVWAIALGAIVTTRRWDMTPAWGGGFALLFVPAMAGYGMWVRRKLGVRAPVRGVAFALESRRLGDYISWPMEALAATVVGLSWWLLLRGGTHIDWLTPLLLSWVALGMLPYKMAVVRFSHPLPAERTEEHHVYQDTERRYWIRYSSAMGWFFLVVLFGGALKHAWSPTASVPGLQWTIIAVAFAVWAIMMIVIFRGMAQLKAMSRNLLPAGSWKTPFRSSACMVMSWPYLIWFAIWFGGILWMSYYPHR